MTAAHVCSTSATAYDLVYPPTPVRKMPINVSIFKNCSGKVSVGNSFDGQIETNCKYFLQFLPVTHDRTHRKKLKTPPLLRAVGFEGFLNSSNWLGQLGD